MISNQPTLVVEISDNKFIFAVVEESNGNYKYPHKLISINEGFKDNKIDDLDLACDSLRDSIYSLEQKISHTFKDVIVIVDNYKCSIYNFAGFKKLNGSQLAKENITYILNSLKSQINEIENQKTVLHIFNSKYLLDKKITENLPIGLFGNFYSQELSFLLIENNYYKNLNKLFNKCNLKVKKIISKSFIKGVNLINDYHDIDNFFLIEIGKITSKITFFENSALKFIQDFNFGTDLILNDISKIIGLEEGLVKKILYNFKITNEDLEKTFIEKEYFNGKSYKKIKKKLILDIADARIQEIAEIIFIQNVNISAFLKQNTQIFLNINDKVQFNCFKNKYDFIFSKEKNFKVKLIENFDTYRLFGEVYKIVQYGWKKEAVPIVQEKKSYIARFFNLIFD